MRIRTLTPLAALAAVAALSLTGCVDNSTPSSGSSTSATTDVTKDTGLAGQVPQKIKDAGKIVVGMDTTYPPNEYKDDNGQPVGWEVELATGRCESDRFAAGSEVAVESRSLVVLRRA